MWRRFIVFAGIWALLLTLGVTWFAASGTIRQVSGFTMGTSWSAQWVVPPWRGGAQDKKVHPEVCPAADPEVELASLLERLDLQVFSTWQDDSELSRLNRQPIGASMPVSAELFEVLQLAAEVSALTGGAFDVTAGALVNLWGFGPRDAFATVPRIPGVDEIEEALSRTGMDRLALDESAQTATRHADVSIDLSAVAKGYAVDRMADLLAASGLHDYFLEIGGELRIGGRKPGFQHWLAALETPNADASDIFATISNQGENFGIAGSGDYRNFFESGGERYSHQIDPRNGRPIMHELAAAYVIDPSTARADALATGLMVLGLDAARTLAEDAGLPVLLIYADGTGNYSDESGTLGHYASAEFSRYLQQ